MNETAIHFHICSICNGAFECFDKEDAGREISTCIECKVMFDVWFEKPKGQPQTF